MKKYILIVLLVLLLASCEPKTEDNTKTCFTGYTLIDNECVKEEDPEPDPIDSDFDNENCTHLDAIDEWEPVWCDEFDYLGLPDDDKWNYDVGGNGWGNGESQYYTFEDEDNAYVDGTNLIITAIKEPYSNNGYTSARLITKNTGDWLYGKVQVKAKLPSGKGTWPAIWMLPTNWEYGGWPDSGEIDIMEHVGYDASKVHSTIHTKAYNHSLNTQIGYSYTSSTLETDFHVYEIEWEPGVIRSYIDGIIYATFEFDPEDNIGIDPYEAFPFDIDFHLILNIAVGGAWGGAQGIDDSIWPQEMVVDYVRVYQKDYASMDAESPDTVTNVEARNIKANSVYLLWDKGIDDVMVKEYEIFVDGEYHDTVSLNGYNYEGLTPATEYTIGIVAVDFKDQKSVVSELTFTTSSPPIIGYKIQAENYDRMSGIQLEPTTDVGGGQNIGWTDQGDYLEYTLVVVNSGYYEADFRVASGDSGGTFELKLGTTVLTTVTVPATGGWQSWVTVTSDEFTLSPGTYTFRIEFQTGGINMNHFTID